MFHAAGWTFPWAITFAFAAQVNSFALVAYIMLNDSIHAFRLLFVR